MMRTARFALALVLAGAAWGQAPSKGAEKEKEITAAEAKDHVGKVATVCGKVVSARYAEKSNGQPTFLNFDKPYPQHIFTVVIWGDYRARFGQPPPETRYDGKEICVRGTVRRGRGVPQVEATGPGQIRVRGGATSAPTALLHLTSAPPLLHRL